MKPKNLEQKMTLLNRYFQSITRQFTDSSFQPVKFIKALLNQNEDIAESLLHVLKIIQYFDVLTCFEILDLF